MSQSQSTPLPQCNSTLCPDQQMLPITGISTGLQSIPNPFVSANPTSFVQNPYYHLLHIPLHHLQQSPGYSSLPNPLGDTSSTVLNSAIIPTPSRKRKKTKQSTHGAKRLKNTTTGPPSSSCGVGPSTSTHVMSTTVPSASGTPPLASYTNPHGETTAEDVSSSTPFLPNTTTNVVPETIGLPSKLTSHRASAATDVWYFLRPLDTEEEPSVWPNPEIEPRLTEKPTSQFVGCKLCTNSWKTWKHRGCKSMTSCYRTHLQSNHFNVWESTVRTLGLKGSTDKGKKSGNATLCENGVFSKEVFYQLLMRWLVVDDQSLNVVECDEFRDLILYLAGDDLDDDELVHRTKLRTDILLEQKKVFIKLREDLLRALGRVSFTTDLWSDPILRSFMAVTAHFIIRNFEGRLEYRSALIAFKHVEGDHSGVNLGNVFYEILSAYGLNGKIGLITMDNASNNNTFMAQLELTLVSEGIEFNRDGNRIRCFPHIINLACQAFLDELKVNPHAPRLYSPPPAVAPISVADDVNSTPIGSVSLPASDSRALPTTLTLHRYAQSLTKDLVGTCRNLVSVCRASGQRQKQFEDIIIEGNKKGFWNEKLSLPVLQLLRDCETRWSSTHQMIHRVLQLYPAIHIFLLRSEQEEYLFTEDDLNVLYDISHVLDIPHAAQEILSAEHTPTLSLALPTYEIVLDKWRELQGTIPELSYYIGVGISKIEEYISLARNTRIYTHAMALNPAMKFQWMKDHWPIERVSEARSWVLESMIHYQTSQRKANEKLMAVSMQSSSAPSLYSATSRAAQAQTRGLNNLLSLNVHERRRQATPLQNQQSPPAPTPLQRTPSLQELEEEEARNLAEDRRIAERELEQYEAAGLHNFHGHDTSENIVLFWELKESLYPLLSCVAMDALPAQASSVSCERAFSSSKETATLRRNRIATDLFEALQILKFSFKQQRLTFTDNIQLAKPEDYCICGPVTAYAAQELLAEDKLEELEDLIRNANSEGYSAPVLELH